MILSGADDLRPKVKHHVSSTSFRTTSACCEKKRKQAKALEKMYRDALGAKSNSLLWFLRPLRLIWHWRVCSLDWSSRAPTLLRYFACLLLKWELLHPQQPKVVLWEFAFMLSGVDTSGYEGWCGRCQWLKCVISTGRQKVLKSVRGVKRVKQPEKKKHI